MNTFASWKKQSGIIPHNGSIIIISGNQMSSKKLIFVSANRHTEPYPVYPLGISYLNSFLAIQMPSLEISIFDFLTGSNEEYIQHLKKTSPDYVCISLRNIDDVNIYRQESFIAQYKQIVNDTREYSGSVIIIGGAGFSIYPQLLFETLKPDFGIYGEGEISLYKLLNALENKQNFKNIDGLLYSENGQSCRKQKGQLF